MEDQHITGETPNEGVPAVSSLRELLDLVSGRAFKDLPQEDGGYAEVLPFPFLALVGQMEMKLALLLALINPRIGGVLLVGPRGTGKTTAVRSLVNMLPDVTRSACFYGCLPEDVETGGVDAVCPDCARKYALGEPLTRVESARLVELPLNARLEDVIGGVDERTAGPHERMNIKRGILAQADQNVLFIDEVNLLADDILDAALDAAATGAYTVRRGPVTATYKAHFTLIGSMNPEEGNLRPQILDRFGLRVIVRGLEKPEERLEAYQRVRAYQRAARQVVNQYAEETDQAREEIEHAAACLAALNILESSSEAVDRLWSNTDYFKRAMKQLGFNTGCTETPIVPVMLGEVALAKQFSSRLFEEGVFAVALGFPTVPQGKARIRVMNTAAHSHSDIDFGLAAFEKVGKELGVI